MKNKLKDVFNGYIYDDNIYIIGKPDSLQNQFISIDDFLNVFNGIKEATIEELIRVDAERKLGYAEFFKRVMSS